MGTMERRGPDSEGIDIQPRSVFGHRRLKIIDLSDASSQPMTDEQLGLSIVFNGAIYNYRELRKELEAEGYVFFSNGDTEVILKSYHRWGRPFVERLNGERPRHPAIPRPSHGCGAGEGRIQFRLLQQPGGRCPHPSRTNC